MESSRAGLFCRSSHAEAVEAAKHITTLITFTTPLPPQMARWVEVKHALTLRCLARKPDFTAADYLQLSTTRQEDLDSITAHQISGRGADRRRWSAGEPPSE